MVLAGMVSSIRGALRSLRHNPGFTAVVVALLGAGVGATLIAARLFWGIVHAPLPYPHPESLVFISHRAPGANMGLDIQLLRWLLSAGAILALVPSAIATVGVVSQSVRRRSRELAIRVALGADRRDVGAVILKPSLLVTLTGITAGVVGAVIMRRYLQSILFEVAGVGMYGLLVGCLAVACAAAIGAALPLRTVLGTEPAEVLRREWDS